jgi:hypothetical protein
MCAPGAEVDIVLGGDDLDGIPPDALAARYEAAGLAVWPRPASAAEVASLGTTWAKRLARSDPERRFRRLRGVAVERSAIRPGSAPRTAS